MALLLLGGCGLPPLSPPFSATLYHDTRHVAGPVWIFEENGRSFGAPDVVASPEGLPHIPSPGVLFDEGAEVVVVKAVPFPLADARQAVAVEPASMAALIAHVARYCRETGRPARLTQGLTQGALVQVVGAETLFVNFCPTAQARSDVSRAKQKIITH
ncbi:MAG: hypothetical protein AAF647_02390 [Pseudomonadota bacterium]